MIERERERDQGGALRWEENGLVRPACKHAEWCHVPPLPCGLRDNSVDIIDPQLSPLLQVKSNLAIIADHPEAKRFVLNPQGVAEPA